MAKNIKFVCGCWKKFNSSRGLHLHKSKADHWVYPKPVPPTPPIETHINYIDLIDGSYKSWGQNMTKESQKHPDRDLLKLGALFKIIDLLEEINNKLKNTFR